MFHTKGKVNIPVPGHMLSQTRMESLCIIHVFNKMSNVDFYYLKSLVLFVVNLLLF